MKALWIWILFLTAPLALAETNRPAMMRGAKLPPPRRPDLLIGVNAVAGGTAEPGWPVIVTVATTGDQSLPPGLSVKMTDDAGKEVAVAFERVKDAWIAAESATKSLKPGWYRLTLVPAGGLRIESGDLHIQTADADTLGLVKIQRALLNGKDDEALAEAARHPESAEAWTAKGDILMDQDSPAEALAAYDKALELRGAKEGENFPLLKRRQAACFRSLEKRGVQLK